MRTSYSQFEMMVAFMERLGDLSRPSDGPHGRVTNIQRWAELVTLLNADASGDTKTGEKWKKTWSDLKNNTKRKAAKISKAVSGTGGGPASRLQLTDLEERVLAIMNPQAATGMTGVSEVGLEQEDQMIEPEVQILAAPENQNDWNTPGTSRQSTAFPPQPPPPPQSQLLTRSPTVPPTVTAPHRRQRDPNPSVGPSQRRRRFATTQSETARKTFIDSDREWRAYQIVKEKMRHETEKERLRLREIELQQQARWQELFAQLLLILEKISDKLNQDRYL